MKSIEELAAGLADEIAKRKRDATSKSTTTASSATERLAQEGEGDPNCPICRGLGYVRLDVPVGHPLFGKLFPCTCRLKELEARQETTLRSLSNLELLSRYTFESFHPDGHGLSPERQRNLRAAYQAARAFALDPKGWLLFIGGYGSGKTHLAAAIANEVLKRGIVPLFVTVPDLLDHLRATYAPGSPQAYSERFEEVRTAPVLILDDLGTENATLWALEKLFQLLNYRYMARLPTVITTNQELDRLDPRLRSRLADPELVDIVTILAPDYRMSGAERVSVDLNMLPYYREMTLDSFDLRRGEVDAKAVESLSNALATARRYAANPEGWLILTGGVGCGKTHLAAAIANERLRQGQPALLVVVPDLLDYLRAAFSPLGGMSYDRRFDEVRRTPFLVLDDLGTESATPWVKEKLFQLINYRYVRRLPTVITTTMDLRDLDPKIGVRLMDVSRCTVFEIKAPPYLGGAGQGKSGPSKRSRRRRS